MNYQANVVNTNQEAFLNATNDIYRHGEVVPSRLGLTRELRHYHITIHEPWKRMISSPQYTLNLPKVLMGAWWVITGTNDLENLIPYYPESIERSDDNITWRGAFGTRLRCWHGIDQIKQIIMLIKKQPETRRASLALFDPVYDFHQSKDVSTTNTIHFLVRGGVLEMTVDMRSVDVITNFGSNNLFEWSFLHEMVAYWTGYKQGLLHFFVNSFHLYEKDFELAEKIVNNKAESIYGSYSGINHINFATPFERIDEKLMRLFLLEKTVWGEDNIDQLFQDCLELDDLMRSSLLILIAFRFRSNRLVYIKIAEYLEANYSGTDLFYLWKCNEAGLGKI